MPPALFKLIGMQFRGFVRRIFKGSTGARRAIMFAVGALVIVLWLLPSVLMARRGQPSDPHRIRLAAPFALLGICMLTLVSSAGDRAISFTPGEVDMLFPGPFSRRQLIGYKLIKSTAAAAASSVVLSIVLLRHARWWPACYAGVLLSLLFIQFFSINTVLLVQTFGAAAQSKLRRATLALVGIVAIVIARHVGPVAGSFDAVHWMERIDAVPLAHAMMSPFAVFGRLMTSESAGELAKNGMLALLIVLGLYALVNYLDVAYVEAATAASARRSAHLQRIRGGSFLSIGVKSTGGRTLPMFPRLAGAGTIAWRQFVSVGRSARGLLFLLLILAIGSAPLLGSHGKDQTYVATLVGVGLWMTMLISTMLKFDFRGDLDLMDALKSLPLHANGIALGQLVTPAILLAATHVVMLGFLSRSAHDKTGYIAAAVLALPVNFLLFAIENLIFLLFPSRPAVTSAGDFSILGRQVLVLAGKMFALVTLVAPPFAIAWLCAVVLAGKSIPVFTCVAGVLLIAEVAGLVPLIGWAFNRFDPSIHTPA